MDSVPFSQIFQLYAVPITFKIFEKKKNQTNTLI